MMRTVDTRSAKTRHGRLAVQLLAVATSLFIVSSLVLGIYASPFPRAHRSNGTFIDAIKNGKQVRLVTLFTGLAGRDAAGGKIHSMTAPSALGLLRKRPVKGKGVEPFSVLFLQQMTGLGLHQQDYDPVISGATIARLSAGSTLIRYPMNVVAVVGPQTDGRVSIFTDSNYATVYVISGPLLASEIRP